MFVASAQASYMMTLSFADMPGVSFQAHTPAPPPTPRLAFTMTNVITDDSLNPEPRMTTGVFPAIGPCSGWTLVMTGGRINSL